MSGMTKSGPDRLSQFGSSQIKSGQVKSSWERSNQVITGQVTWGKAKFCWHQSFFLNQSFLGPNIFWTLNVFDPQFFFQT